MKTASTKADFDQHYQTHLKHLKLKGLQPKTIDAYSRAIRRMGDYFGDVTRRCCINRNWVEGPLISTSFQIFTDTGMPRFDMMFSADALTHASVFCCGSLHAFIAEPMMRL